jgi:hypothetical protein
MSRMWLRLISCVCLSAYLLANTHASFALESAVRTYCPAKCAPKMDISAEEATPTTPKCKHCCKVTKESSDEQVPCSSDNPTPPCDEPSCPCCPNDRDGKQCPCPGGCAMCSVAKAPLPTTIAVNLHNVVCTGRCQLEEAFDYVPPLQRGLIRPPRA